MERSKIENKWYKDKRVWLKVCVYITIAEFLLLIVPLLIDIIFQPKFYVYYSFGRIIHFIYLVPSMSFLWWNLPNGKIIKPVQILLFFVIPISEFILINISGISNWWGMLYICVYYLILIFALDYDLDIYSSSHSNNGELSAKFFESLVKGLLRKL